MDSDFCSKSSSLQLRLNSHIRVMKPHVIDFGDSRRWRDGTSKPRSQSPVAGAEARVLSAAGGYRSHQSRRFAARALARRRAAARRLLKRRRGHRPCTPPLGMSGAPRYRYQVALSRSSAPPRGGPTATRARRRHSRRASLGGFRHIPTIRSICKQPASTTRPPQQQHRSTNKSGLRDGPRSGRRASSPPPLNSIKRDFRTRVLGRVRTLRLEFWSSNVTS